MANRFDAAEGPPGETTMYSGQSVTVMALRPSGGGEVTPLVCENRSERRAYERLFRGRAPYHLDGRTPLARPLQRHFPSSVIELLPPPDAAAGAPWPWIVAVYSPGVHPEFQRGHWAFEFAGDDMEAKEIAKDLLLQTANLFAAHGLPFGAEIMVALGNHS